MQKNCYNFSISVKSKYCDVKRNEKVNRIFNGNDISIDEFRNSQEEGHGDNYYYNLELDRGLGLRNLGSPQIGLECQC